MTIASSRAVVRFGVHFARSGKEFYMRRVLMLVAVLMMFSAALVGCRAEGEVDVTSVVPAAR